MLVFIPLFILLIGPWPVDETPFQQSNYAKQTINHIRDISRLENEGNLRAGSASIEIKPIANSPLAGYSARDPKTSTGAIDKIYAKAISISNNNQTITLLSAEILLPLPQLVNAVVKKTGLNRNEIYFSVTHTHSGPGGYASGIIETASMGKFSQKQFDILVNALSSAVSSSRENLTPVTMKYSRLTLTPEFAGQFIYNQLYGGPNAHNSIHSLEIFNIKNTTRLATLITFSAHPTFLGRANRELSGDYPNLLMRKLEEKLGGNVMFSIGAVGGMLPVGDGVKPVKNLENEKKQLKEMGESLSSFIAASLQNPTQFDKTQLTKITSWNAESSNIQSELIPVALPYPSYRITDNLRLSPFIVNSLFHDNDTFIHALKIGKLFFLAYPADYSGELAASLENWGDENGIYPWTTTFNGEYIGYIMPSKHYDKSHYSVRDVNFFGRWAGDYFLETSKTIIETLK